MNVKHGYYDVPEDNAEEFLRERVVEFLCAMMPEYYSKMPEEFIDGIIADVMECSGFEDENVFTDDDIRLSFEREIASRFGVEI